MMSGRTNIWEELGSQIRHQTARCELAKRLELGTHSIAQVAFLLDVTDQAAFSLAFKRWTGTTPAVFRKAKSKGLRPRSRTRLSL